MGRQNRGRATALVACALALAGVGSLGAALASGVDLNAKDAELSSILQALAAAGGPRLAPHPDLAAEHFTFAARGMSRTGSARWLCRVTGLIVVTDKSGKVTVAKPAANEAVLKSYKVGTLVHSEDEAKALTSFLRAVIVRAFEPREKSQDGVLQPDADIVCQGGELKVLAPDVVHKEVLALLQAMARAKERGNVETMSVDYGAYDLGFFRSSTGAKPPTLEGKVSLELTDATAADAAWELTARTKASFYADSGDPTLAKAKATLRVQDKPLQFAAHQVAEALGAELAPYDGAWLLVRQARKPLYEGLVVRVYHVGGEGWGGRPFAEMAAWRARGLELPQGLPYAIERVGDRLLACAPLSIHERLSGIAKGGDWGADRDRWPRDPGGPRGWGDRGR